MSKTYCIVCVSPHRPVVYVDTWTHPIDHVWESYVVIPQTPNWREQMETIHVIP